MYTSTHMASAIRYLQLPFDGAPASSREDDQLDLEHGIKTFSAYPGKNLLAILEEWVDHGGGVPYVLDHPSYNPLR